MKLPADYKLVSLQSLRNEVSRDEEYSPHTEDELHMSTEQYLAYKELVWKAGSSEGDPIMKFDGLRIVIPTEG